MKNATKFIVLTVVLLILVSPVYAAVIKTNSTPVLNKSSGSSVSITKITPSASKGLTTKGATCSEINASDVRYSSVTAKSTSVTEPSYLNYTSDCAIINKDSEVTRDLNSKLSELTSIKRDLSSMLSDAKKLVKDGNRSISCFNTAEHRYTLAAAYPSMSSSHYGYGGIYSLGSLSNPLLSYLENFYDALDNVYYAKNHANASFETLRNFTSSLSAFCSGNGCVFAEQKTYYSGILTVTYGDIDYYINQTEQAIKDARGFANDYKDYNKSSIDCSSMSKLTASKIVVVNVTKGSNTTQNASKVLKVNVTKIATKVTKITNSTTRNLTNGTRVVVVPTGTQNKTDGSSSARKPNTAAGNYTGLEYTGLEATSSKK